MTAEHDAIPEAARAFLDAGKGAALATVIETWGSSPRPVGAQLAISSEGEMVGSVSGGCVEGAVIHAGLDAIKDGQCRVLEFGVSDEDAFAVGLACGGTIRVMVEPVGTGQGLPTALLDELIARREARKPAALVTDIESWERQLCNEPEGPLAEAIAQGFISDRSRLEGSRFVHIHNPPLRLIVVGAVHIAQPLLAMARLAGYDVTLIDPRETFAADHRFPGETILQDWPDEAIEALAPDARTAIVTLTHDPKFDDAALKTALGSDAFYIGALGSTRTHAKRLARLEADGVPREMLDRIHAPIGLDIGAKSPAEIAISIMAEMTERLRRPETRR